jgi:ATP-dependent Clp protease ATP-binding subunit ClpA
MFDRFTNQANRVLRLAGDEARRLGHDYVGTEHVLLGLLREGTNLAARVLARLGIELRTARLVVETQIPGHHSPLPASSLPRTPRVQQALDQAVEEARRLGHDFFVGPEHLLLALLHDEDGTAAHLLARLGRPPRDVRAALLADPGLSAVPELSPRGITTGPAPPGPVEDNIQRAQEVDHLQNNPAAQPGLNLQLPDVARPVVRQGGLAGLWRSLLRLLGLGAPASAQRVPAIEDLCTQQLREVLRDAEREARRHNHEYVGAEHLLLGLLGPSGGAGAAVLRNLGLNLDVVRREVERIVPRGPDLVLPAELPLTPRAEKVVEYAATEARHLGQGSVGTEHLLLGLLREQEAIPAQVLMNLGIDLQQVRRQVLRLLAG